MFWKKKKGFMENVKTIFDGITKMTDIVDKTERKVVSTINTAEKLIRNKVKKLKKVIFYAMLQLLFAAVAFVFLVVGVILFFARFYPLDYVLIIGGLILMYLVLVLNWMK